MIPNLKETHLLLLIGPGSSCNTLAFQDFHILMVQTNHLIGMLVLILGSYLKAMFRSHRFVERPDPLFRKLFDWPIHKDPKGTTKTQTVLGLPTSFPSESSRGYDGPMKKKKRTISKTPLTQKVADEDFLLLQDFILEYFGSEHQVFHILSLI